jgi:uncharacterized RDD family membrane protein YckC
MNVYGVINMMKLKYAGFWKRFVARAIDIAISLPFFLVNYYFIKPINDYAFGLITVFITVIFLLYNILFVYYYGKTPGKMILKLRVCANDGNRVNMKNCILREGFNIINFFLWIIEKYFAFGVLKYIGFISGIISFASFLEFFLFFFNRYCKTVHDYFANTVVIDEFVRRK